MISGLVPLQRILKKADRYARDGASSSEVVPVVDPSFIAILVSASEIL